MLTNSKGMVLLQTITKLGTKIPHGLILFYLSKDIARRIEKSIHPFRVLFDLKHTLIEEDQHCEFYKSFLLFLYINPS